MAKLITGTGNERPDVMTVIYRDNRDVVYASINVNVRSVDEGYEWDELVLPDFALDNIHRAPDDIKYKVLVAHIVKAYYDDNTMTAISNNYLGDIIEGVEDQEHKQEFIKMQKVRKLAKETAKHIINNNLF